MNVDDTNVHDDDRLPSNQEQQQKMRKCHGNRKDQCFRRKWRARGMEPAKIEKLLRKRKKNQKRKLDYIRSFENDFEETTTVSKEVSSSRMELSKQPLRTTATITTTTNLNKRKRDRSLQELKSHLTISKSTSSISIQQPLSKKVKKPKKKTIKISKIIENNNTVNKNYRFVSFISFYSYCLYDTFLILADQCI